MSYEDKPGLAIIGLGHISEYQIEALRQLNQFEFLAACDIDSIRKRKLPNNIKFFADYRDLLVEKNIDSILISTPISEHYEICKLALDAGKNVLLEKPATSKLKDFEELVLRSKSDKQTFVIAFHARFALDLIWFIQEYKSALYKDLGDISGVRCNFYDPYIEKGILLRQAKSLGGSWLDSGVNALSVIDKIIGIENLEVEGVSLISIPQFDCTEIHGSVNLISKRSHNRPIKVCIDTNWTMGLNCKITRLFFESTGKEIVLHHSKQQVLLIDNNRNMNILADFSKSKPRLVNHYIGVFENFHNHINNGTNNLRSALLIHKFLFVPYELSNGPVLCH